MAPAAACIAGATAAAMGLAPLKENLAAGLIALTGWDGRVPLIDPLCGSGTLLIEAAAMVLGRAPGLDPGGEARGFALRHWADFSSDLWDQEVAAAQNLARSDLADGTPLAPLVGLDHDPGVLAQARRNGTEAGLSEAIHWQDGDLSDLQPPSSATGLLVCNPPYGERIGPGEDLATLYGDLGPARQGTFRGLDPVAAERQSGTHQLPAAQSQQTDSHQQWGNRLPLAEIRHPTLIATTGTGGPPKPTKRARENVASLKLLWINW